MAKTKRCSRPTTSRLFESSRAKPMSRGGRRFSIAPIPNRDCLKRRCAGTAEIQRRRWILVLRARRDQGHDLVSEAYPESRRLYRISARCEYAVRGIGKATLEILERLALETGSVFGGNGAGHRSEALAVTGADCTVRLQADHRRCTRDARRHFAEKLAADAASIAVAARGQAPSGNSGEAAATAEDDTSFNFGTDDQHELFALIRSRMRYDAETSGAWSRALESSASTGSDLRSAMHARPAVEGFRSPGGAATLPEVIKFLIDRTGYVKCSRKKPRRNRIPESRTCRNSPMPRVTPPIAARLWANFSIMPRWSAMSISR